MTLWSPDDFVHMLYLRKQYQGRGIGTALLRALPDWPDRKYRLKCLDRNERAKAFYRSTDLSSLAQARPAEGDYEEMTFFPAR
jgi:GNAT superfamily N-acetyltransferase